MKTNKEDEDAVGPGPESEAKQPESKGVDASRVLTYGERAVGLMFNPSNDDAVGQCKKKFSEVIDQLNDLRNATTNGEVARMCSVAITDAQSAQMWGVKAITWRD